MTTQTVSNEKGLKVAIRQRMIQVFITILIQALILFGAAGTLRWWPAWAYVGLYLGGVAINALFMFRRSPETIAERGRASTAENWKTWDKILGVGFAVFYFIGILLVAGLDEPFGWTTTLATGRQIGGFVAYALGSGLFSWAMITNAYFSDERE